MPSRKPAKKKASRGSFVIAASIVLVGLLIVGTLVVMLRQPAVPAAPRHPSPVARVTPQAKRSPRDHVTQGGGNGDPFSPVPDPPSPSASPTAQPVDDAALIRDTVTRAARKDRPHEVTRVANVNITSTEDRSQRQRALLLITPGRCLVPVQGRREMGHPLRPRLRRIVLAPGMTVP